MTDEVISKTYKSVEAEINDLDIPMKEKVIAGILSALVSLLIVAGPIVISINLMIFNNYIRLAAFLIVLFAILFVFLTDFLYLHYIAKKQVSGLYHIWAIDTTIFSLLALAVYMIMTLTGVM